MNKEKLLAIVLSILMLGTFAACAGSPTQESTGEYVDDSRITTVVKSKLLGSKNVSGTAISVETFKGTVQLSGFVDTDAQRKEAERLASSVKGVRSVENRISVKGS